MGRFRCQRIWTWREEPDCKTLVLICLIAYSGLCPGCTRGAAFGKQGQLRLGPARTTGFSHTVRPGGFHDPGLRLSPRCRGSQWYAPGRARQSFRSGSCPSTSLFPSRRCFASLRHKRRQQDTALRRRTSERFKNHKPYRLPPKRRLSRCLGRTALRPSSRGSALYRYASKGHQPGSPRKPRQRNCRALCGAQSRASHSSGLD